MSRLATLLFCSILSAPSARGLAAGPSDGTLVRSDPPCSPCDEVVRRVVRLLPRSPLSVVVIDPLHTTPLLRDKLRGVEGFVVKGDPAVYLTCQGPTFRHALDEAGIWDFALAIITWHEMAHLDGADEGEAQKKEEALWLGFIRNGRIDARRGMSYLALLRKRTTR